MSNASTEATNTFPGLSSTCTRNSHFGCAYGSLVMQPHLHVYAMDDQSSDQRDWRSAATMLRGALGRVERHIRDDVPAATSSASVVPESSTSSRFRGERPGTSGTDHAPTTSAHAELGRLFGYRPDVSQGGQRTGRKRKHPESNFLLKSIHVLPIGGRRLYAYVSKSKPKDPTLLRKWN